MSENELLHDVHRMVSQIDDRVNDLRKAVFGNGRPGLLDRMTVIEQRTSAIVESEATCPAREAFTGEAARQSRANYLALAAVVLAGLSVIMAYTGK
jgi:hypothetical protein